MMYSEMFSMDDCFSMKGIYLQFFKSTQLQLLTFKKLYLTVFKSVSIIMQVQTLFGKHTGIRIEQTDIIE